MQELRKYQSHKIVEADKITKAETNITGTARKLHLENSGLIVHASMEYGPPHCSDSDLVGGYYVVYSDGYASWSPAAAFEAGYTEIVPNPISFTFDSQPLGTVTDIKFTSNDPEGDLNLCEPDPDADKEDPWEHRSEGMRCTTCMWFVAKQHMANLDRRYPVGRCRRHAPTMGGYPVVYGNDWCGDHKLDESKA